jgi:hypothetical protein
MIGEEVPLGGSDTVARVVAEVTAMPLRAAAAAPVVTVAFKKQAVVATISEKAPARKGRMCLCNWQLIFWHQIYQKRKGGGGCKNAP